MSAVSQETIRVELFPMDQVPPTASALVCLLEASRLPVGMAWDPEMEPCAVGIAVVDGEGSVSWASYVPQEIGEAIGGALLDEECEENEWFWAHVEGWIPSSGQDEDEDS